MLQRSSFIIFKKIQWFEPTCMDRSHWKWGPISVSIYWGSMCPTTGTNEKILQWDFQLWSELDKSPLCLSLCLRLRLPGKWTVAVWMKMSSLSSCVCTLGSQLGVLFGGGGTAFPEEVCHQGCTLGFHRLPLCLIHSLCYMFVVEDVTSNFLLQCSAGCCHASPTTVDCYPSGTINPK